MECTFMAKEVIFLSFDYLDENSQAQYLPFLEPISLHPSEKKDLFLKILTLAGSKQIIVCV